jgi:hypothetical protein
VIAEIESAGVEVENRNGKRKVERINQDKLKVLSADVVCSVASRFGGDKLADLFEELTQATHITNGGREIPDNRIRLAAAIYIANHLIGMPIQRQEILSVSVDADAEAGLAQRLKSSPALRQVFRRVLDEIDGGEGKEGG